MKHTADPNSLLGHWCDVVANMKPGQKLKVKYYDLRPIGGYHHNGADFGPVDRILGNMIGSAFTHSYDTDPMTGDIIFTRHEDTSHRHYVSPDQRQIIIIDEAANIQPESWPNPEKSE